MSFDITPFAARITDMQKACVTGSAAYPGYLYAPGDSVYWTNQLTLVEPRTLNADVAATASTYTINVMMRLHRGDITQGYRGDLETQSWADIFNVLPYFRARKSLTLNPRDVPITYTVPNSVVIISRGVGIFEIAAKKSVGSAYELTFRVNVQEAT